MEKVHTEPKLSLDNKSYGLLGCVDKDERIIVEHKTNATRIEVFKSQHQLSQIDLIWKWQEGNDSIFYVMLVDKKNKIVMKGKTNLTDDVSLSWEVLDVFKLDIPPTETITDINFTNGNIQVFTENTAYEGKWN